MTKTLHVTPVQVLAAELAVELQEGAGETPDEALKAIANPEVVAPEKTAASHETSADEPALSEVVAAVRRIEQTLHTLDLNRLQPSTQPETPTSLEQSSDKPSIDDLSRRPSPYEFQSQPLLEKRGRDQLTGQSGEKLFGSRQLTGQSREKPGTEQLTGQSRELFGSKPSETPRVKAPKRGFIASLQRKQERQARRIRGLDKDTDKPGPGRIPPHGSGQSRLQ